MNFWCSLTEEIIKSIRNYLRVNNGLISKTNYFLNVGKTQEQVVHAVDDLSKLLLGLLSSYQIQLKTLRDIAKDNIGQRFGAPSYI